MINKFAKILLQELEYYDVSQKELADTLGVTRQTVNRWINGVNEPDIDEIIRICVVFDKDPNYILGFNQINLDEIVLRVPQANETKKETLDEIVKQYNDERTTFKKFVDKKTKGIGVFAKMEACIRNLQKLSRKICEMTTEPERYIEFYDKNRADEIQQQIFKAQAEHSMGFKDMQELQTLLHLQRAESVKPKKPF